MGNRRNHKNKQKIFILKDKKNITCGMSLKHYLWKMYSPKFIYKKGNKTEN